MQRRCQNCGEEVGVRAKFCRVCGSAIDHRAEQVASGEWVFPAITIAPLVPIKAAKTIGPIRVLFSGGLSLIKGFFKALKSPRKLLPGLILGLVWMVISILPNLGIFLPGHNIATFLTFAQGGLQGGGIGLVGGVVGKGIYASVLTGLFKKRPAKSQESQGPKSYPGQPGAVGLLLMGIGLGFVLFNFFTWNNSVFNSVIGLVAAVGTLRAIGRENGFLRRLIGALTRQFSAYKVSRSKDIKLFGGGLAAGFALAVPMSALVIVNLWVGYLIGIPLLLIGILVALIGKLREGVRGI